MLPHLALGHWVQYMAKDYLQMSKHKVCLSLAAWRNHQGIMELPAVWYEGRCAICKVAFPKAASWKKGPSFQGATSVSSCCPSLRLLVLQAISSGLQNISSKTPRDPSAAAMVADAVRIIDNYIKVGLPHLLALALVQRH